LNYHKQTAELLAVGSSSEVYRINFEQGIFMKPIESITETEGINVSNNLKKANKNKSS
jgi:hypothetical protein